MPTQMSLLRTSSERNYVRCARFALCALLSYEDSPEQWIPDGISHDIFWDLYNNYTLSALRKLLNVSDPLGEEFMI
jgi:hypothetical protein